MTLMQNLQLSSLLKKPKEVKISKNNNPNKFPNNKNPNSHSSPNDDLNNHKIHHID